MIVSACVFPNARRRSRSMSKPVAWHGANNAPSLKDAREEVAFRLPHTRPSRRRLHRLATTKARTRIYTLMTDAVTQHQVRGLRTRLNQLRMPELRNILMDLNLARSGRKSELVERIASEMEVRVARFVVSCASWALICPVCVACSSTLQTKRAVRRLLLSTQSDWRLV